MNLAKGIPPHGGLYSKPAGVRRQMLSSSNSNKPVPADLAGRVGTSLTPAERMKELAVDPFIRDTGTRASLEFHRCAHENAAKWWKLEKQTFLVYPSHPSEDELAEALKHPAEIMVATLGEMAAAQYATEMIVAYTNLASFSVQRRRLGSLLICAPMHSLRLFG